MVDITKIEEDLAASEAQVPQLRPHCAKRVIWADQAGVKTSVALLYIHGFSASLQETRPLPDLVAKELGANIHFTRLTGHGQDSAAMGRATFAEWTRDVTEAVEIAQALGDEIIIMGCSTGCTMATLALAGGVPAKAVIYISPNFGLRHRVAQFFLDLPGSQHWAPLIVGRTRRFPPINEDHTAYWTTSYPTRAVHPMGQAMRAVSRADLATLTTPAFFCLNEDDQVVNPADIRKVAERWGGAVHVDVVTAGPDDDQNGHVMAGDVFSPSQTAPMAQRISAWLAGLTPIAK